MRVRAWSTGLVVASLVLAVHQVASTGFGSRGAAIVRTGQSFDELARALAAARTVLDGTRTGPGPALDMLGKTPGIAAVVVAIRRVNPERTPPTTPGRRLPPASTPADAARLTRDFYGVLTPILHAV